MTDSMTKTKTADGMRRVRVEKVTVNVGVGETGDKLNKAKTVIERLAGRTAALTTARKRVQVFGIRKGDTIGAKITLRGESAIEFLKKAFDAVDSKLNKWTIDRFGNFSFGVKEYIDFPGSKYDPTIGLIGFDVAVTMSRSGGRISQRRRLRSFVPLSHRVTPDETVNFLTENFKVNVYD